MTSLERNLRQFQEDGGSNSELKSKGKLGENEDPRNESSKDPKKEKPSSSTITPSQYLFKMEKKVDINPYQGDIKALRLNNWLRKLQVYFFVYNIDDDKNMSISRLELQGHTLTWW